ncbi:AAA family ATPase [Oxynema aestuarii]|uniref:AAA family ATPase n=1 Tax=Oxynema aestuarii AP17 TaxID=2064643 RepID=A0A6H1U1R9_9CYAN|nr:AAA family ATPase [Oxynema aestuarii]QIZ72771.1 AAA family ATPase [Oxynema aestuarii AP17]RMH75727.1 MAG: ParA family protein [Cyanobacteria bacterium J007]
MRFNPNFCRNESEVESKLIVSYLLPKLGYPPESWHQEVTFSSIRLDFLAFATQAIPFVLSADSPLTVVMEAKHPRQKLDRHVRKFRRYLTQLHVKYGLLTNGKQLRIYRRDGTQIKLVFQCSGDKIDDNFSIIESLIGRDRLQQELDPKSGDRPPPISSHSIDRSLSTELSDLETTPVREIRDRSPIPERTSSMKVIAVYHNKGGVGKTTVVVNLAAALRKQGKRVLVIDIDSQANTTFATGLIKFDDEEFDDIRDSNILHVLQSEEYHPIDEVARTSEFCSPEIDVIPAHIDLMQYESELNQLDYSRLSLLDKLDSVRDRYDIVLIDTPPSLNLYARIALITADYVMIPSDLKPFSNQGLNNVKDLIKNVNGFRKQLRRGPVEILGILPCKISTNARFIQSTFQKRRELIPTRYGLELLDSTIYDRDDLAKCSEQVQLVGDLEIACPRSVLDFKPDSTAAQEFEVLALEVLNKTGLAS